MILYLSSTAQETGTRTLASTLPSSGSYTANRTNAGTVLMKWRTPTGTPNNASWGTHTDTVKIDVTGGNTNYTIRLRLNRISSTGTVLQTTGYTGTQSGSAGIKTFTLPATSWSAGNTTDRIELEIEFNNSAMGSQSITISEASADSSVSTGIAKFINGAANVVAVAVATAAAIVPTIVNAAASITAIASATAIGFVDPFTYTTLDPTGAGTTEYCQTAISDNRQVMVATRANGTNRDAIWISEDEGDTWAQKFRWTGASGYYWYPLAMTTNAGVLYAGCGGGDSSDKYVIKTTDLGDNWTDISPESPFFTSALATSSNGSIVWATSFGNRQWRSTDYGGTWTEIRPTSEDKNAQVNNIAISSDGVHVYMMFGDTFTAKRIYYSDDSGATFTEVQPIDTAAYNWYALACSSNGQHVYAAVVNGRMYYSDDYGSTWAEIQPYGNVNSKHNELKCSADGSRVYVADGNNAGGALAYPRYSTDYGSTWRDTYPVGSALLGTNEDTLSITSDGKAVLLADSFNSNRLYFGEIIEATGDIIGSASVTAIATATAQGVITKQGAASVTAVALATASGTVGATVTGAASVTAVATAQASAIMTKQGSATVTALATASASATLEKVGSASITAIATAQAAGVKVITAAASVTAIASATMQAQIQGTVTGRASVTATATATAAATVEAGLFTALRLGNTTINRLFLGSQEILKAYIGNTLVFSRAAAPVPLLFDAYGTGAAQGISTSRMLKTGVTTLLRIRRSSDNVEQNFTAEQLNANEHVTFVGAGNNGFVVSAIDHSGNSRPMTNGNAADQPIIVSSGTGITSGGKPAMKFQGSNHLLVTSDFTSTVNRTFIAVIENIDTSATGWRRILTHSPLALNDNTINGIVRYFNQVNVVGHVGSGSANTFTTGSALAANNIYIIEMYVTGSSNLRLYVNGTLIENKTITISPQVASNALRISATNANANFNVLETAYWLEDKFSDRAGIYSILSSYYL